MGDFGPGSKKKVTKGPFSFAVAADDNKRRPEQIYIRQAVYVTPKLNIKNFIGNYDPDDTDDMLDYSTSVGQAFDRQLNTLARGFKRFIDKKFFVIDAVSPIVTRDFVWQRMSLKRKSPLVMEYYLNTVNEINDRGDPVTNSQGEIKDMVHFEVLAKAAMAIIDKILKDKTFSKNEFVQFHKGK